MSGSLLELFWRCQHQIQEKEQSSLQVEIAWPKPKEVSRSRYVYQVGGGTQIQYQAIDRQRVPTVAPVLVNGYRQADTERLPMEESELEGFSRSLPGYLLERGFSAEILVAYEVLDDIRHQRAIVPIRDWDGVLWGWSGRTYQKLPICQRCNATTEKIGECQKCGYSVPKWLHSTGLDRKHLLYGSHQYELKPHVIVQEGFLDVWRTAEVEQDENGKSISIPLAIMGSHPNPEQLESLLRHHTGWIWTMGDNDEAGRRMNQEMIQMMQALAPERRIGIIWNPAHRKDPGELSFQEGRKLNQCLQEVLKDSHKEGIQEIHL
jgi:5-methylcytosine-specific restriction endonuclease McrA